MTGLAARKMSPMKAKVIVGLGAALLASIAIAAIAAVASLTLTRPAPEVKFNGLTGDTFTTSDLRGKVVVVNFWATWCPDCIKEMPKLVDTHRKFATRGYETVAVALAQAKAEDIARFDAKHALPLRIGFDCSGEIARARG